MSSYPGANTVGQARLEYPSNTYILRAPDPVMFPEDFYLRCFDRGIGRVYEQMKAKNIRLSRLKLTTICTVCKAAFLKEIADMEAAVSDAKTGGMQR
jgi:hypothetical protein